MPCTRDLRDMAFMVKKMEDCKVPGLDMSAALSEIANKVEAGEGAVIIAKDEKGAIKSGAVGSVLDFFGVHTFWLHFIWATEEYLEPLEADVRGFCEKEGINSVSGIMKKNYAAAMRKYGFYEDGIIVTKKLQEG